MIRLAGGAAVLSTALFWIGVLVAGALRPGYDHVRQYISELGVGQNAWLISLVFVTVGALNVVFALGLANEEIGGRLAPGLLLARGLAVVVVGLVPGDPDVTRRTATGALHNAAVALSVILFGAACLLLVRRFRADARWSDLATPTLAAGVLALGLLAVQALFTPQGLGGPGAPLAAWAGAVQRASLLVATAWVLLAGARLLRR